MSQTRRTETPGQIGPAESRVSIVLTVGWMLGAMATFGAELVGVLLKMLAWSNQSNPHWLQATTSVLFLTALVTGLTTLILTPICLTVRPVRPPRPIVLSVLAIASMPLLVLVVRTFSS